MQFIRLLQQAVCIEKPASRRTIEPADGRRLRGDITANKVAGSGRARVVRNTHTENPHLLPIGKAAVEELARNRTEENEIEPQGESGMGGWTQPKGPNSSIL